MKNTQRATAGIGFVVYLLVTPALLSISARTVPWPMAPAYVGLFLLSAIGSRLMVLRRNPDTVRHPRPMPARFWLPWLFPSCWMRPGR